MKSVLWWVEIVEQLAFLVKRLLRSRINTELEQLIRADPVEQPATQIILRATDECDAEAPVAMLVPQCKDPGAFVGNCRGYAIVV